MVKNNTDTLNPGHYLEVAERAESLMKMIIISLMDQPAVIETKFYQTMLAEAKDALGSVQIAANDTINKHKWSAEERKTMVTERVYNRVAMFGELFYELIVRDPTIQANKDLRNRVERIASDIWKISQEIGTKLP